MIVCVSMSVLHNEKLNEREDEDEHFSFYIGEVRLWFMLERILNNLFNG